MKRILIVSASAVLLFTACKQPETAVTTPAVTFNVDSAHQEINASNEKFGVALVKGDSATIASLYTSDGEIYVPNTPKMNVKTMAGMIIQMPAMGIRKMVLTSAEVAGGPEIVTETGVYEMSDSTKVFEKGKYIVLWKKEDGKWKMFRDIWNSDAPMLPAPAAAAKK